MEAIGRGGCGCCPSTGEGRLSTRTVDLRVSRPFFCAPRLQANFPPRNSDLDHLAAAGQRFRRQQAHNHRGSELPAGLGEDFPQK